MEKKDKLFKIRPVVDKFIRRFIARTYLKKDSFSNPKISERPSSSIIRKNRLPEDNSFDPIGHILAIKL